MTETQTVSLQDASCSAIRTVTPFSATAAPGGVNIRSAPSVSASIVGRLAANEGRSFDGWTYGDTVYDAWTGQPDARWYRLSGTNTWVASGVVHGNPTPPPPTQCSISPNPNGFFHNPEAFFQWANGQRGIARLDTTNYLGECVTLIARYVQEVFLPTNERITPRAYGDGKDTASVLAGNSPFNQYFGPFTSSGLPRRGAVISFPARSNNPFGHVAIVLETQGQMVKLLESNRDEKAPNTTVTNDRLLDIGNAHGWTNPR